MFWSRKFLLMPKNKNKPSQSFSLVSGSGGNHLQVLTNPIFAQNDPLGDSRERERGFHSFGKILDLLSLANDYPHSVGLVGSAAAV